MGHRKKISNIISTRKNSHEEFELSNDYVKSYSPVKEKHSCVGKKDLRNIIKEEYSFISNLFDIIDIAGIKSHGRKDEGEEEEESLPLLNMPEKKIFKKQGQKKGAAQLSSKKSFPATIEGLEKELEEIKGKPSTYQTKLRKKGLQSRLIKKKRKEEFKLRKVALKQGKKIVINGVGKQKPVFNNNGVIVSNKFDFADSEIKKETKRKLGSADTHSNRDESQNNRTDKSVASKDVSIENGNKNNENKSTTNQGPVFNKDNKMVFSRVLIPESNKRHKKKSDNDPKKLLEKIKEKSKMIKELKKEDKEKANLLQEKHKWSLALKRASGEKVKDDPELLKRSIMREKNKKLRSTKKWQARIDKVQKEKDERQKKRTENILARKNDKKKRKMKRAIKKGSFVQV